MQQPSPPPIHQDAGITTFSDEDDARLFKSCGGPELVGEILRIKHNDPTFNFLQVRGTFNLNEGVTRCPISLNGAASRRLGDIIGQNTHLEELFLFGCGVDVEAMCAGLQGNLSIQKITLLHIDLQNSEVTSSLAPFLVHKPRLKYISLASCDLGPASINILADALSNKAGNSLEELNLCNNPIGDNLDGLIQVLGGSRSLRILRLDGCEIGQRACGPLATLLDDQHSNLTDLHLENNFIDNQSTITLARSLVNNKNLRILDLGGNNRITTEGWAAMLQLVFNRSSVNNLIHSNHVLHSLRFLGSLTSTKFIQVMGVDDGNLLHASLELNGGSSVFVN